MRIPMGMNTLRVALITVLASPLVGCYEPCQDDFIYGEPVAIPDPTTDTAFRLR